MSEPTPSPADAAANLLAASPTTATAGGPAHAGEPAHRAIRSFVLRTGRTTVGQAKAVTLLGPQFMLPFAESTTDFAANFPPQAPAEDGHAAKTILEIGFGMGEATAQIAQARPEDNFVCCEVHSPGVGALLKRIGEQHIANIRIVQHDAVQVLAHMVAPASLDGIHIFFPDPWHKKRHNKRRLIQAEFIAKLTTHMRPGAYLHCATDWEPYAVQILQVLSEQAALKNTATAPDGYAPKPWYRPLTKFENRGIKLGHGVWDIVFERV
jgi:tRNA (guanine-N7-)-methyltransferase